MGTIPEQRASRHQSKDRKQYVAVMAGGGGRYFGGTPGDSVMAFSLGQDNAPAVPVSTKNAAPPECGTVRTPVSLPDGPGENTVQRSCGAPCHGVQTAAGVRRDRAAWTATVDNMVARGATVKEADLKVIIDYLTRYVGK